MILKGAGVSAGVGIGTVRIIKDVSLDYSHVQFSGRDSEKQRVKAAVETFCEKTEHMIERMKEQVGQKESEILAGQIAMMNDPYMQSQIAELVEGGQCAEAAVDAVCGMYIDMFSGVEDEMMRQRATDVRDIRTRMLRILLNAEEVNPAEVPEGTILVARDFTPSMTVGISSGRIMAIVTEVGGKTSHSAILARALEIPAVLSVPGIVSAVKDGELIIADGGTGQVHTQPDERTVNHYTKKRRQLLAERDLLKEYKGKNTTSADGELFHIYSNIGKPSDAKSAVDAGAEGIGLFRTEFLFMDRSSCPSEEEQLEAYREASRIMEGREVIIRTLDVGGDKEIQYLQMEEERNPFLGYRAIRYCLDRTDIFSVQLRALLRAGADSGNIRIMLPLVTSLEEVRSTKQLISRLKNELKSEGLNYDDSMKLGVMIETPAAALIADLLAREVDFFSIGTNDLTQYTMAVDRGNAKVEKLYTEFHPAVLRSIRSVIRAAKEAGIPVGMCGEAAADPCLIPLLMAWGLDEFSVSPSAVLGTRKEIAGWTRADAELAAQEAMKLSGAAGIEGYLKAAKK